MAKSLEAPFTGDCGPTVAPDRCSRGQPALTYGNSTGPDKEDSGIMPIYRVNSLIIQGLHVVFNIIEP